MCLKQLCQNYIISEEEYQQGIHLGKKKKKTVISLQLILNADYNQGLKTKSLVITLFQLL